MQLEQTRMSMDAAVPCGLILNELVSNALKYAFPDGREGEIRIELRREPGQPGCLSVSDNGVGLPADVTLWSTKSLGLRLVRILAVEVNPTAETRPGTEIRLTLPADAPERKS
jgi:two-component sensor histidine kinase